ncbi:histidine kinase, partial [Psychrobacter sp. AOP29-E1-7]
MSITRVSLYVVTLLMTACAISMALVQLIMINMGWFEYNNQTFILAIVFDTLIGGGFTLVFLLYFLRRYREMNALKQSFEHKLSAQNDVIKARLSPHFFFNT